MTRLFRSSLPEFPPGALPRPVNVLDMGARWGTQWPWNALSSSVKIIQVEADPVEAKRLMEALPPQRGVVLPVALWRDDRTLPLFLNKSSGTSSVFRANRDFLDQFPEAERFEPVSTVEISTRTIDGLVSAGEMPVVDFAKIDVQGAELAILEGGVSHLASNLVGLELEVEFAPLYSDQPLFADVDSFVREELGLELWDLGKSYWKYKKGVHVPGPIKGRLMFSDALYLRSLSKINGWIETMPTENAEEKVIMLVVCAIAYGYIDYAHAVLNSPDLQDRIEPQSKELLQRTIGLCGSGFRPFKNGNRVLHFLFNSLAKSCQPSRGGWATNGQGVGSRKRGPFWW